MTTAVGGNIKVVLTLDDAGFTVKTREASGTVKALNSEFRQVTKAADGLESKIGTLGKNVSQSTQALKGLQGIAKSLETQFNSTVKKIAEFGSATSQSVSATNALMSVVNRLTALLDGVTASSGKASAGSRAFAQSQREASRESTNLIGGLTAQERAYRNIGANALNSAKQIVLSATMSRNANARRMAEEFDQNEQLLASKRRNLNSMLEAERAYQRQLTDARSRAMAIQMKMDTPRDSRGRIVSRNSDIYHELERQLAAEKQKIAAIEKSVSLINQEAIKIDESITAITSQNRLLERRVSLEEQAAVAIERQNIALTRQAGATVNGMTAQQRAQRNLGNANEGNSTLSMSAQLARSEIGRQLAQEAQANAILIAQKRQTYNSLLQAERQYQNSLNEVKSQALAKQMQIDELQNTEPRRHASVIASLQAELAKDQERIAALQKSVSLVGQEAVKVNEQIPGLEAVNRSLRERVTQEERAIQAAIRQKQVLAEQKAMMEQQVGLLKGMAQLYTSSKIWQGEKSSLSAAAEYERTMVRVQAFGNFNQKEMGDFQSYNVSDSKANPGVSYNDAAVARLAAMSGLATKDQALISKTLSDAINSVKNIQYLTGDHSRQGFEDMTRNLYGVAEARQQQYDPEATKKTFDLMTRIYQTTGNKIDIKDIETFIRRIGTGANKISDEGIIDLVAMLDQAKVSGGGGGGGAGGISTIGTMIKMFQAYANGKTLSNNAVKEFADAGVLNTDGIDRSATAKEQLKSLKNAGLNNSALVNSNPIQALINITKAAMADMTSSPEKIKKWFGNADPKDAGAQRDALNKWATSMGMTTTASSTIAQVGDPRFQQRTAEQAKVLKEGMSGDQLKDKRMETYDQAVDNFNASLENLKTTLGTSVLPMMTTLFQWIEKVVSALNSFSKDNPIATKLTMIAGAAGGVVLAFKGFMTVFGIMGNLRTVLTSLAGGTTSAATGVGLLSAAAQKATPILMTFWTWFSAPVAKLLPLITGFGATFVKTLGAMISPIPGVGVQIAALASRFMGLASTVATAIGLVGKTLMRALPFVGWLLTAWDLTKLIGSLEVGGARVSEWFELWFDKLAIMAKGFWNKFKGFMTFGVQQGQDNAFDSMRAELDARQAEFDAKMKADAAKKAADEKKRKDDEKKRKDTEQGKGGDNHDPNPAWDGTGGLPAVQIPSEPGRVPRDQFVRSLAEITSKAEITAMEIANAISNRADDLMAKARTEFYQKWKAGDFDPDHNEALRPFKGANGDLNWNATGKDGGVQMWLETRKAQLEQEEQLKALTYANERLAAAREDANVAMERTDGDSSKQTREMQALQRELARTEERLKNGTKEFAAWNAKKNEALFQRSRADVINFSADFADTDRQSLAQMQGTDRERVAAEYDRTAQKDRETFQERMQSLTTYYNEARAQQASLGLSQEELDANLKRLDQDYYDAKTKAETAFTRHAQVQAQAREYALRTAVQKMEQDWTNSFEKMDEVAANWGNSFIDSLTTALTGGQVSWRNFLASMLKDVLNMQLKQAFAKPMSSALSGISGWITGALANKGGAVAGAAGGGGIASAASSMMGSIGGMAKTGVSAVAKFFGFDGLSSASSAATNAMKTMTTDGVQKTTEGLVEGVIQNGAKTAAETTQMAALDALTVAATACASALWDAASAAAGNSFSTFFANGGIMSSAGSLPLKMYAKGGIANRPQVAVFGEGSMNEAYVPLPDGRSIPVSFTGQGVNTTNAGNTIQQVAITIQVDNNGKESSSSTGDEKEQWNGLAQKVKAVVREELVTQKRPGGILAK